MATTTTNVSVPRGPFALAGQIHRSTDLPDGPRPAVVVATPGSSVKEQIGAVYAAGLAEAGFVALAFDPGYQGQSGGEPRDLEDPYERGADLRFAIDHLVGRSDVDPDRIGILGVCAGGGYAVHTAMTDHRIKAVGTVVPVNIGRARRDQYAGEPGALTATLEELAGQRTVEAQEQVLHRVPWIPDSLEDAEAAGLTDVDLLEAIRFYRTPRGASEFSTNRRLTRSDPLMIGFDAFHLADTLLTQPVMVVVGGRIGATGSFKDGQQLVSLAPSADPLVVVEGAGHYEMYDEPAYVSQALDALVPFYADHLAAA